MTLRITVTKELINQLNGFNLLYVEDEKGIQKNIHEILDCMFKNIYLASDGEEAYRLYEENKPDLIITDIKMPKLSGIELIKKIRKVDSKVRVIVTSAHTDLNYMLDATELHLVKYIVKPITQDKLIHALEAFIQSYKGASKYNIAESWVFDESKSIVISPDEEFVLTKKENAFLKLLVSKKRLISYEEIENILWDDNNIMTQNALRLFIKNFRKKLPNNVLKNVQGTGYRLVL